MNDTASTNWLTTKAVCDRYGINPKTLDRWAKNPEFPATRRINGRKYFAADELAAWDRKRSS